MRAALRMVARERLEVAVKRTIPGGRNDWIRDQALAFPSRDSGSASTTHFAPSVAFSPALQPRRRSLAWAWSSLVIWPLATAPTHRRSSSNISSPS